MREMTVKKAISQVAHILAPIVLVFSLSARAFAAAPGITGPTFNLTAQQAYLNQPDGEAVYSWGYGCNGTPAGFAPTLNGQTCPTMQVPGPTLIVHENAVVTVTLLNGLPNAAGNTSILFPGFNVTTTCPASTAAGAPQQGLLTCEAAPGGTVTYTFTASAPGTHAYYSGTQGDLQIEMGLYGAVIVLPASVPANCTTGYHAANPHMDPGELTLIRTIGQGRWQHPFHEHANHVRILARDGNLVLSGAIANTISYNTPGGTAASGPPLAGLLMFNTDTTPGEAFDGIFYFTGRGLNWDPYGHHPVSSTNDPLATLPCTPDANGYNSGAPNAVNFMEWCQDHNKPVQVAPFGDVAAGGPATLPDPNVLTNGQWYGGTPYLGPDASLRAAMPTCAANPYGTPNPPSANCTTLLPSNTQANPASERGWAFMWHSHNEREITTNNVFPGGMLMMMLVDSREFVIDESL